MLLRWLGNTFNKNDATEPQLTQQFFVTLRSNFRQCDANLKQAHSKTTEKIESILKKDNKTWADAYEIERLMTTLFTGEQIKVELDRRLVEAERNLFPNEYNYYKKEISKLGSETAEKELKALLDRLINDLQWRYTISQLKRELSQRIRLRFSLFFISSTILFLFLFPGCVFFYSYLEKFNLNLLLIAGCAGIWGASFSMIISTSDRLHDTGLENLRLLSTGRYISSRVAVGTGASLIFYFFLQSGLLSGAIFPKLNTITQTGNIGFNTDLYLLVIWSVIAGFSEKLVPNLLNKTERKVK